jgi:hypothetical protein
MEPPRRPKTLLESVRFPALPGTEAEARALAALLDHPTVVTGAQATEDVLRGVHGPRILHVATHGFFLEDEPQRSAGDDRGFVLDVGVRQPPPAARGPREDNPLLRSGLVFAGANRHAAAHDGLMTALEASALDLWGTELVVLSACETGMGKVENADGVFGLRRALVMAGAESQVMSLWKVDDEATRELMTSYYARLVKGGGRSEALRQAQIELSRTAGHEHPYYWASFIPSGEWRTLDGQEVPVVEAAALPGGPPKVTPGARGCGCRSAGAAEGSGGAGAMSWAVVAALVLGARARRRVPPRASRHCAARATASWLVSGDSRGAHSDPARS